MSLSKLFSKKTEEILIKIIKRVIFNPKILKTPFHE